jgi:osmotically-inducible protein OsmY
MATAARQDQNGLLLAAALAVAVLAARPSALAQAPAAHSGGSEAHDEVIISASREADAALAAQVTAVIEQDPYIFGDHITVAAENGMLTLRGVVEDLDDLRRALILARRIAGGRRVVNRIEFIPADDDHD